MDAGNAVTPLCFPNFQNEVFLALADASAVDSSGGTDPAQVSSASRISTLLLTLLKNTVTHPPHPTPTSLFIQLIFRSQGIVSA